MTTLTKQLIWGNNLRRIGKSEIKSTSMAAHIL